MLVVQAGDVSSGLTFVIGGPHGTSEAVRKRADMVLRLSSMVLNHQVVNRAVHSIMRYNVTLHRSASFVPLRVCRLRMLCF